MGTRPAAEVDVDVDLVRRLLGEQHPDLADRPLRPVSSGWDNVLLRLGDDLAVRVPRRAAAAGLVLHEQRWLPVLAPRLGVPVPVPVRLGRPSPTFPWAWSVVRWHDGRLAATLPPPARAGLAVGLADVVARLHRSAPPDAPRNPVRGGALRERDGAVRDRVAAGAVPRPDEVLAAWDDAVAVDPWAGPPRWVHGDLHPANLLVAADGGVAAVLDFGDLAAGDPAVDLATAWLTFDAGARATFRHRVTALTGVDGRTWARARGWALVLATAMLAHGDDDPLIAAIGRHTLAQALGDRGVARTDPRPR